MRDALKRHWPEYLMEAAGLGLFMISAGLFGTLLFFSGSPIADLLPDPTLRRALMGAETVAFLATLEFPLSEPLDPDRLGELQRFTPTIEALVTPDIDVSLDDQPAKTRFWSAFKTLGTWWSELPPY